MVSSQRTDATAPSRTFHVVFVVTSTREFAQARDMRRVQTMCTDLLHALDLAIAETADCFAGFRCRRGHCCRSHTVVFGGVLAGSGAVLLSGYVVELGGLDLQVHPAELFAVVAHPNSGFRCEGR